MSRRPDPGAPERPGGVGGLLPVVPEGGLGGFRPPVLAPALPPLELRDGGLCIADMITSQSCSNFRCIANRRAPHTPGQQQSTVHKNVIVSMHDCKQCLLGIMLFKLFKFCPHSHVPLPIFSKCDIQSEWSRLSASHAHASIQTLSGVQLRLCRQAENAESGATKISTACM